MSLSWSFKKKSLTITLGLQQFTLAVEHWIKMDIAEILQGRCACADAKWVMVGISMHQVSSPPLPALKPQPPSDCMGDKLAAGSS